MPFTAAYRCCTLRGVALDPAGGPDIWAGFADLNFIDQNGNTFTPTTLWIHVLDGDLRLRMARQGAVYGDDIQFYMDEPWFPMYFTAQTIQLQNMILGTNSTYQIVGLG